MDGWFGVPLSCYDWTSMNHPVTSLRFVRIFWTTCVPRDFLTRFIWSRSQRTCALLPKNWAGYTLIMGTVYSWTMFGYIWDGNNSSCLPLVYKTYVWKPWVIHQPCQLDDTYQNLFTCCTRTSDQKVGKSIPYFLGTRLYNCQNVNNFIIVLTICGFTFKVGHHNKPKIGARFIG